MKYRFVWLGAAILCATSVGCGNKQAQVADAGGATTTASASTTTPAGNSGATSPSKPSVPASNSGAASGSGSPGANDENSGGSPPSVAPNSSRPTLGLSSGGGTPQASEPNASAPSRPSIGVAGGGGAPVSGSAPASQARPSVGNIGAPAGAGAPALTGGLASPGSIPGGASSFGSTAPASSPSSGPFPSTPPQPVELSLRDRAVEAFRAGNAPRAYALLQAHSLHIPNDEIETVTNSYRWDKKRVVPRYGYNFAVGLVVKKSGNVTDLKPIGTDLNALGSTTGAGAAGRGAGGRGGPPRSGGPGFGAGGATASNIPVLAAKELSDAAGKYATTFVDAFRREHSDGRWSEAFREYDYGSGGSSGGNAGGFLSSFGGAPNSPGSAPPGGGRPGLGGGGGPPAGYNGGGGGGPPAGYGGGGPPAGYNGGGGGAPPGYGSGQGGPPAGYNGGGGGAPPGYGSGQGGPPADYRGGGSGAPPGYGTAPGGGPPGGSQPAGNKGSGNASGGSTPGSLDYIAPYQDDAISPTLGAQGQLPGTPPPGTFGNAPAGNGFVPPSLSGANPADLRLPSGSIPLGPGLVYIGSGDSMGELAKKAIEQHFDALVLFEVDVTFVRANGTTKNDCRIRVVNLHAEKDSKDKSITSTSLNARDVASDKNPDSKIDTAVDGFIKKMIEAYPMEDLPNIPADAIKNKRLATLAKDTSRTKLDLLGEVQLYFGKGLIDETIRLEAFGQIAGPDGRVLAAGSEDEKLAVLEKMIRREFD